MVFYIFLPYGLSPGGFTLTPSHCHPCRLIPCALLFLFNPIHHSFLSFFYLNHISPQPLAIIKRPVGGGKKKKRWNQQYKSPLFILLPLHSFPMATFPLPSLSPSTLPHVYFDCILIRADTSYCKCIGLSSIVESDGISGSEVQQPPPPQ